MARHFFSIPILLPCILFLLSACEVPIDPPSHDNPKDPDSPYWTTQAPSIYQVMLTPDSTVMVSWVSTTKYAVGFRIERRIALTGSYSVVGSIGGSAATNSFIDSTYIPRGHTYGYRVGVVGAGGAVIYSYDYDIDVY